MLVKNRQQVGTDSIFPLTARFGINCYDYASKGSMLRVSYGQVFRVEEFDQSSSRIYVVGATEERLEIHPCRGRIEEIFNECVAARSEGRFADLTKFSKAPSP